MHVWMIQILMMHMSMIHPWSWCNYVWCIYLWSLSLMYIGMMPIRTMHIPVILDPEYDGYIYDLDPWPGCIYACIHDAYIYDPRSWCMHVWCIYVYNPWSWCIYIWPSILMHACVMQVWMMLISMILDPEACISDAGFFSVGRTNQRTDGQADSRSWMGISFISTCATTIRKATNS